MPWGNVLVGDKTQTSKDRIFKEIWNILVPFDFFLSRGRHLPGMRIFRRTGTTRLKISPKNTQSPKQQGCNGFVCFCDDRDGCNSGQRLDDHQQIFSPLENNNPYILFNIYNFRLMARLAVIVTAVILLLMWLIEFPSILPNDKNLYAQVASILEDNVVLLLIMGYCSHYISNDIYCYLIMNWLWYQRDRIRQSLLFKYFYFCVFVTCHKLRLDLTHLLLMLSYCLYHSL